MNRAILYICATSPNATDAAMKEGNQVASLEGLTIVQTITDPFGEPDPARRLGWQKLTAIVDRHADVQPIPFVIARWPNSISRDPDIRFEALNSLAAYGTRLLYSWLIQEPARSESRS